MDEKLLEVNIAADAIQAFTRVPPLRAVEELVWNSLDADATKIEVVFSENDLGGVSEITITDNGHGIPYGEAEAIFRQVGGSKKALGGVTPTHSRPYHGREGKGRYKAFALGSRATWRSRFVEADGKTKEFEVVADYDKLKHVKIGVPELTKEKEGCTVVVSAIREDAGSVQSEASSRTILQRFAPYLIAFKNVKITYGGSPLRAAELVKREESFDIEIPGKTGKAHRAKLRIIEWRKRTKPKLYLCDDQHHALDEREVTVGGSRFSYTAYLSSSYFRDLNDRGVLTDLDDDLRNLVEAARDRLRDHFRARLAEESAQVVNKMQEEGTYPYKREAKTEVEVAERQVFDICAAKIHQYLPAFEKGNKATREFTYTLLKESLERNPTNLTKIIGEVVKLPRDEQDELAALVQKTSLSAIIKTAKTISDRLAFINGLEQILHDGDKRTHVRERSQLQRILVEELWIFGDQYTLGTDDVSLKNVLKAHIEILERTELAKEIDPEDVKELTDIPDLCLWRQYSGGVSDAFAHLVIELKAPRVSIGFKEIGQAQKYAQAVDDNRYFDKTKTTWKFMVLSDGIKGEVEGMVAQQDRPRGLVTRTKSYEVWAKTWAEIIQEAKTRHTFLRDKLEGAVKDNEEGMRYLREKYAKYLSPKLGGSAPK